MMGWDDLAYEDRTKFLLTDVQLRNVRGHGSTAHDINWDHYHAVVADKYGRKLSRSALNADRLVRGWLLPRIQKGKKRHPASYDYLTNFLKMDRADVREGLSFLRRKRLLTVAVSQYSLKNDKGEHVAGAALYQVDPELITSTWVQLDGAEEASVMFEFADGRVVHLTLAEYDDLKRESWVVENKPYNLLNEIEKDLRLPTDDEIERLLIGGEFE